MWKHVRGGLLLAGFSLIPFGFSVTSASAQLFSRGCKNCQRPVTHCNCQSHQPVVETQMIPQQVTTYRNEVVTQYRQEAVTQTVPVTTYRDVVVDEGSYQTVYVPKQVTKRIPQVTYQQQVAYRSVPYQVTRQVPQVTTQMVPQQAVRYQPYSYSFQTTQAAPVSQTTVVPMTPARPQVIGGCVAPMVVAPCGPCGGMALGATPIYQNVQTIGQPVLTSPVVANPVTMLAPTATTNSSAASSATADPYATPVPDPKFLDSPGASRDHWTTVGSKSGKSSDSGNSQVATKASDRIRFEPARTVYRSWESQSRFAVSDGPERR